MISNIVWHDHYRDVPEGAHAFLGASNYHWLNYSEEKLISVYRNRLSVARGTELHAFAATCIKLRQKLPRSKKTLNMYVNDAIGFGMRPEQPLFYSENCFGTADSILFKNGYLRIHDLKTGLTPASIHQLEIYASLFFLEYGIKPGEVETELRIYQNDDILIGHPEADDILPIMDQIIRYDKILEKIKEEEAE